MYGFRVVIHTQYGTMGLSEIMTSSGSLQLSTRGHRVQSEDKSSLTRQRQDTIEQELERQDKGTNTIER